MKNIQVIDDALNCLFEVFEASNDDFNLIFPNAQDIEFAGDFVARVGETSATLILDRLWKEPRDKKRIAGVHGTLFYGDANEKRKPFFPTKKEAEMVPLLR
jgi:hypothetical protein